MGALRFPALSTVKTPLAALLLGTLLLFTIFVDAAAIEEIVLSSGRVQGPGWSIARTVTRLRVDGDAPPSAELEASGIELPGPFKKIAKVRARCAQIAFEASGVICRGGELHLRTLEGEPVFSPARFEAAYGDQGFRFSLAGLELGSGVVAAAFEGTREDLSFNAEANSLPVSVLFRLFEIQTAGTELAAQDGVVSGTLSWRDSSERSQLSASLDLEQVAFSDPSGLNAGENLAAGLRLEASRRGGPWVFQSAVSVAAGQVYLHPIFLDAAEGALELNASGKIARDSKRVAVEEFSFVHHGVGKVDGSATLAFDESIPRLDRIVLATEKIGLARFHAVYVKPWLVDSALSKVNATGNASARVVWAPAESSEAALTVQGMNLEDEAGRFSVRGISGDVHWRESGAPRTTRVRFESAKFYRIELGSTELVGAFSGSDFGLASPLEIPLLGGALHVESLEATDLGGGRLSWRMRGELKPISVMDLTRSLGWPSFTGSLSGEVPLLRYADGEANVDGKLDVRVFDGRVQIHDLKLAQPFGVVPRLTADIVVDDLSLGALTSTFSFGKIEGRLSGRIDDLVLENWRPSAFHARFATPTNDKSRHRISQRAVENLARIGGTGQVLSSTLFGFLESFSYDRLGISCRLENGVCEMGGIKEAERGYYIVKGGGLPPRIDVFGFNTRVDWSTLVERLKAITRANEAVIR